jgi:hydroxypyruvate isomerase
VPYALTSTTSPTIHRAVSRSWIVTSTKNPPDPARYSTFDVAQRGEGNLIELLRRAGSLIGEVQVADVPGRREPGIGEINYPMIAGALEEMGYHGTVGLEAYASGDDVVALERFRAAFSRPASAPSAGTGARR